MNQFFSFRKEDIEIQIPLRACHKQQLHCFKHTEIQIVKKSSKKKKKKINYTMFSTETTKQRKKNRGIILVSINPPTVLPDFTLHSCQWGNITHFNNGLGKMIKKQLHIFSILLH